MHLQCVQVQRRELGKLQIPGNRGQTMKDGAERAWQPSVTLYKERVQVQHRKKLGMGETSHVIA